MNLPFNASKSFIVPVFIPHAGCPHRCVFCNQTTTTGQKDPFPHPDRIRETISRFLNYRRPKHGFAEIAFYGGNFLGLPMERIGSLLSLAQDYVREGRADGIRFSTRPDTIDSHRLNLIDQFAVTTVELGVQSLSNDVLAQCRRGHGSRQTVEAVALLRKNKSYRLGLQMMIGLPGDSAAGAMATARQIIQWAPDFVRIYPTLVLKGSLLEQWYAEGKYLPLSLDEAVNQAKTLFALFSKKAVRVIRMGLQPTEELNPQASVVAGPFHPAFGELVRSDLWLDVLKAHFRKEAIQNSPVTFNIHPRSLSCVKGQKSTNLRKLTEAFGLSGIEVVQAHHLPVNTVIVNGKTCRLNLDPHPET
jgi:histone acetyltransferase (RNA polymerase elongator complex component)